MNKICYGCGVKMQAQNIDACGYVPEKKLKDATYCMRCFRLMHYGENVVINTPKEAKEIVNKINKDNRFVIFLVDFLNLNSQVIDIFKAIKKRKVLVVNKCELIPKHIKKERLLSYIEEVYGIRDDIKLKGGSSSHGAKAIYNYLLRNEIKEAYILGISNSGKSTLINDLMKITDSKMNKITVNDKANTTLDFIRVKLDEDLTLIDSPGFILNNSLDNDASGKNITAYSVNMKECETLSLLDKKYFLKFDADTPIIFYTNSESKKAVKKYFKAADNLVTKIEITKPNMDIILTGIGFITVKKSCIITSNIDYSAIEVRDSMFGDYNE